MSLRRRLPGSLMYVFTFDAESQNITRALWADLTRVALRPAEVAVDSQMTRGRGGPAEAMHHD